MTGRVMHPRPNPIVAAMYTLRDMDVDVIVVHGPAGCGFMASRPLEEAGVRVVTTAMRDDDLIFGASEALVATLRSLDERFRPGTVAVVGTCASMIIGEDMEAAIARADLGCRVFAVDCHGCMGANTEGAVRALAAGRDAGLIDADETERQIGLMRAATRLEQRAGMAASGYLSPSRGPTKLGAATRILDTLEGGGRVAVVMIAKKELAYRFADIFVAVDAARARLGGETLFVANLDGGKGLPRIRGYCRDIVADLDAHGVAIDAVVGGLDEYSVVGGQAREAVDAFAPDLTVVVGVCHAYPGMTADDILITDQPRQLANYLSQGLAAVGEIASHSMVMGVHRIVHLESADTVRELLEGR